MKKLKSLLLIALAFTGMISVMAQSTGTETVADVDGSVYRTVIIGNYMWMAKNLRTTPFGRFTLPSCNLPLKPAFFKSLIVQSEIVKNDE